DINQGWLYQQRVGQLRSAGTPKDARDAAERVTRYMPSANAWVTLGLADYDLGEKTTAAADFRKAIAMDPNVKSQLESGSPARWKKVSDDKVFVRQVLEPK